MHTLNTHYDIHATYTLHKHQHMYSNYTLFKYQCINSICVALSVTAYLADLSGCVTLHQSKALWQGQ